jgi:hypothetical protein
MRSKIAAIFLSAVVMLAVAPVRSFAATCFCKVTANGTEVAKPSKGGYIQGLQTEACKNYCRGQWDSRSSADLLAWAKLLGKCGDISLRMDAAIGTASYQQVRSTSVKVPCDPPPPPSCNLLQNGNFSAGINVVAGSSGSIPPSSVASWASAFGTPQISATDGCNGNPGFITMWGNQVVGEGIRQTLSAPLVPGHNYQLLACVKWHDTQNPVLPKYVRLKARISNGALGSYTATAPLSGVFGAGSNITSTQWATIALPPWTAPAGPNLNTLTITPENDNAANDGNTVSWGSIDNVCLMDLNVACQAPSPDFTLTAVLTAGNTTTYQLTATNAAVASGVGFWWQVEELDPVTSSVLPNTTVTNPSLWWTNSVTNVFAGYNGTGSLSGTAPGVFKQGHKYRISRGVWDVCHPWLAVSHTVFMSTP